MQGAGDNYMSAFKKIALYQNKSQTKNQYYRCVLIPCCTWQIGTYPESRCDHNRSFPLADQILRICCLAVGNYFMLISLVLLSQHARFQ